MSSVSSEAETPTNFITLHADPRLLWRDRTVPKEQFSELIHEEMSHIWDADPRTKGRTDKKLHVSPTIIGGWLYDLAREEIQAQWMEQGIWNKSWEYKDLTYNDIWNHEIPEREKNMPHLAKPDPENDPEQYITTFARSRPQYQAEAERRREASRPLNMFLYQVSNECERQRKSYPKDVSATEIAPDINTLAYGAVRSRWERRHIWDEEWGVLPGMIWRHEKPEPELTDDEDDSGAEERKMKESVARIGRRLFGDRYVERKEEEVKEEVKEEAEEKVEETPSTPPLSKVIPGRKKIRAPFATRSLARSSASFDDEKSRPVKKRKIRTRDVK